MVFLTFRRRQKAKVGMFTVKKKGNKQGNTQRLIVDCRQANFLQRRPACTRLATPAGLTALDLSRETLCGAGFSDEGHGLPHLEPSLETGDVGDCFYNFVIKEACSWFSTGDVVDTNDMKKHGMYVDSIYDDELGRESPVVNGERLFIYFGGMPMGWSWALYFAQNIISEQCRIAGKADDKQLIRDKHPAPTIQPGAPAIGVYVDNVHAFGGNSSDATDYMNRIQQHFTDLGIPFDTDSVSGCDTVDTLGLTFSFVEGRTLVRAKRERAWRLWLATRALVRRRRIVVKFYGFGLVTSISTSF